MSNFHPLEVVDRASETELQVCENLYWKASRVEGLGIVMYAKLDISVSSVSDIFI